MSANVQYMGFTVKAMVREFSFLVRIVDRLSRDHLYDSERGIYVPPFEPAERT
jgi:hypothetical protein